MERKLRINMVCSSRDKRFLVRKTSVTTESNCYCLKPLKMKSKGVIIEAYILGQH